MNDEPTNRNDERRTENDERMSIVYLIGAGPGDPGLITVRGLQYLAAADVVLYDHLVPARLLRAARADAEQIDVGTAALAAAGAGGDLLSARGKGARGQDRRASEMGRSVRVRQRRVGSAVPARAGRPLRSGAGHSGRHRGAGLCGHPDHLPGRRRHGDVHPRPRRRGQDAGVDRLGQPGASRRHARLLRRAAAAAGDAAGAARARTAAGRLRGGGLRRHAPDAADHRRHARRDCGAGRAGRRSAPRDAGGRSGRGAARTPALVRRAAAVRQADPGDAPQGSEHGPGRSPRSDGRRGDRGADGSHPAARGLRRAGRGLRPRRRLRLDRVLERQRRRRVHRTAAGRPVGSARARRREAVRRRPGDGGAAGAVTG